VNPYEDKPSFKKAKEELARLKFLEDAEIPPGLYVAAKWVEGDGFDLPQLAEEQFFSQALLNIAQQKNYGPPAVNENTGIILGTHAKLGTPVGIPDYDVPSNILITGGSGTGKTNLGLSLIDQFRRKGITCRFWDYKGEANRLPFYWRDAVVFTPQTAPWQFLEPVGDPMAYYTGIIGDIRLEFELRPETFPLLWQMWERILRGMVNKEILYPSWEDFCRVAEHQAKADGRENLLTAARALRNICVVLGPQARVRKVPDISDRYRIVGYDFVGQDPKILRLFLGFHFTRLIMKCQEDGLVTVLRAVDFIDEGSVLFSSELMLRYTSHISAAKRMVSMGRFTGNGLIISTQNLSQTDSFAKQNAATLSVFRTPSVDDAIEAAKMLGLPRDSVQELMRLACGEAYVRSIGWKQPVKIHVPLFKP